MQTLPRNGSYVQRRKMYIELPMHNMKSKVPIDWNSDQPPTYERHRSIAKQMSEKEYIKRIYDLKMERKLKQIWNPEGADMRIGKETNMMSEKEALAKQVEEFNTSKVLTKSNHQDNNAEYAEPQQPRTPSVSSKQGERNQLGKRNERERKYSERQRSYESERDRGRHKEETYINTKGNYVGERPDRYAYNERPLMDRSYNELDHNRSDYYSHNQYPSQMYRGESDLGSHPYRPPYYIAQPRYQAPYLEQNQYSYDVSRQRKPQFHPELPPGHPNPHPFRNQLPDRLEEFLRQKTKADRKSAIVVNLKDR